MKKIIVTILCGISFGAQGAALIEQEASEQLVQAAEKGNLQEVKRLLQDPAFDINAQDDLGNTALIAAIPADNTVSNNQIAVITFLLEQPTIDVDLKEITFGRTALMKAAEFGHKDIVQMLLDRGADLLLTDNFGKTARLLAIRNGHLEIASMLTPKQAMIKSARKHNNH